MPRLSLVAAATALVALFGASPVLAADPECSLTKKCPKEAPCCSQYGACGVGAYCLGGCDPRMSASLDACVPAPVCKDKVFPMTSLDGFVSMDKYLGDSSKADWVYDGKPLVHNGNVLLTMPPHSSGTVLASTVYMWYGTLRAKFKTSRFPGVVSAMILLSDVKDEIDYEFVGSELDIAQTNYYWQGTLNYTNSANISTSDTFENWHEYEIKWTPNEITWSVDGKPGRTRKRADTWNGTTNQWMFPQTPSRVQISIWPGGDEKNPPGTIQWAGGKMDWNNQDIKDKGYDYATLGKVEIECFKTDSPPGTNSKTSYIYNNIAATNDTVVDGDGRTVLKSLAGSGLDMDAGDKASGTSSAGPKASIPGSSSSGPGTEGQKGGDGGDGGSGSGGSGSDSAPKCKATGFTQDCSSSSSSDGGSNGGGSKNDGQRLGHGQSLLGASAFGAVVAMAAVFVL